ncbi:MAG TPA: YigZ family protein [Burkholderiaceae bacterium]|nr:YigZ family protein [Burkholderiaceae bacterium]
MPLTLAAPAHSELQIRKSRFIGCVEPVAGRVVALQRVSALRAAHPGAAHVCWALMAGGESAAVDDGEPSGTAGRPMLDVLRHHDLEGVLATVVRYFGGVKLGAGGLVRAYTDAVAQALLEADKVPLVRMRTVGCSVPYAFEGVLRRSLEAAGAELLRVVHGGVVEFEFALPEADVGEFMHRMTEASHGQLSWDRDAAGEASGRQ